MKILTIIISLFFCATTIFSAEQITPYKFSDEELKNNSFPNYEISKSAIFSVKRNESQDPDITFYYSKPKQEIFPIAIFCTGSSSKDNIDSIIHIHRHFLREFLELGAALITLEQWGVEDKNINAKEFIDNYTRTRRLTDHKIVIESLLKNPPAGWNGKFIFVGVSEGGPLVTSLTEKYSDITIATVNWSGAGDYSWREELWDFWKGMKDEIYKTLPWYIKLGCNLPKWFPFSINFPRTRKDFDIGLNLTLKDFTSKKEFLGMSYKYHEDALTYPDPDYSKLKTPYLVVSGAQDTLIQSSDLFVKKAKQAGANITYFRVADMDHYVRKRPDIIERSFKWLKNKSKVTKKELKSS